MRQQFAAGMYHPRLVGSLLIRSCKQGKAQLVVASAGGSQTNVL
jgi:hypothetical protein